MGKIQEITKCIHVNLEEPNDEIYAVFVVSDKCCHDICETCFLASDALEGNSVNSEASYTVLYYTWEI